jgi:phosphatidylserine decarboxylase
MLEGVLIGILLALVTTLPLAWKWHLGLRRTLFVVVILALLSGLTVAMLGKAIAISVTTGAAVVWLMTLGAGFAILAYCFFRDPERRVPDDHALIVSPADGEVLYVRQSLGGILPITTKQRRNYTLQELTKTPLHTEDAVVIGIGMSFLDVHVNRAPIEGRITIHDRFPGRFASLRSPEMVFENERVTTVIERAAFQVAVIQIASRLVRRIVPFVRETQEVTIGQRIGMIRFGSQVDLVLPAREDLQLVVKPGERVWAGESVVAVLLRPDESTVEALAKRPQQAGSALAEQAAAGQAAAQPFSRAN